MRRALSPRAIIVAAALLNGPGCLHAATAHTGGYHDYSTGFRCCADPR